MYPLISLSPSFLYSLRTPATTLPCTELSATEATHSLIKPLLTYPLSLKVKLDESASRWHNELAARYYCQTLVKRHLDTSRARS